MLTEKEIRDLEEMEEKIRVALYAAFLIKICSKWIKRIHERSADEVIEV